MADARDDPRDIDAFVASLRKRGLGLVIPDHLDTLRAEPALTAAIRERLPQHLHDELDTWLERTVDAAPVETVQAFLHRAVGHARDRWPDFPHIRPGQLAVTSEGYAHFQREADTRVVRHGRPYGWFVRVNSESIGPAEIIDIEQWQASAHGPDGVLQIERDDEAGPNGRVWRTFTPHPVGSGR